MRNAKGILTGLAIVIIALHSWSLMRYPSPFVDEAWNASRTWAYIQTGHAFSSLDYDLSQNYTGYWTYFPLIPTLLETLFLRWVPQPSLLAVRLEALLFGFILLAIVCFSGWKLGGWRLGLAGTIYTSLSSPFLSSAHLGRPDIIVATLGFGAILLSFNQLPRRWWMNLLSGLLIGLAIEIHPNAIIYGSVGVGVYIVIFQLEFWRKRLFWLFTIGMGFGFAFYIAIHILPFPQTYYAISQLQFASTHTPPLLTFSLATILEGFISTGRLLLKVHPVELLLFLVAVVYLLIRHSKTDRIILPLVFTLLVSFALLVHNKLDYYAVLITPALDILVCILPLAIMGVDQTPEKQSEVDTSDASKAFLHQTGHHLWRQIALALVVGMMLGSMVRSLTPLKINHVSNFPVILGRIRQVVRPEETIMGTQTYWFGLYDHEFDSWEELIYYQRNNPSTTLDDAMRYYQPDIFIIDGHLDQFLIQSQERSILLQSLQLPREQFERILDEYGTLLMDFYEGQSFGRIRVYRFDWSRQP